MIHRCHAFLCVGLSLFFILAVGFFVYRVNARIREQEVLNARLREFERAWRVDMNKEEAKAARPQRVRLDLNYGVKVSRDVGPQLSNVLQEGDIIIAVNDSRCWTPNHVFAARGPIVDMVVVRDGRRVEVRVVLDHIANNLWLWAEPHPFQLLAD